MRFRRERKLRRLVARLRGPQQFYTRGFAARDLSELDAAGMARELLAVRLVGDGAHDRTLHDSNPHREEAAESLAFLECSPSITPLVSVLARPDVRIRFRAVFALRSVARWKDWRHPPDPRAVEALESVL